MYTGFNIGDYPVYDIEPSSDDVICESFQNYTVLYEKDDVYYTTRDLVYGSGCYYKYTILYNNDLITIQEAIDTSVIQYDDLEDVDFPITIVERIKLPQGDISKVKIYEHETYLTTVTDQDIINKAFNFVTYLHFQEGDVDTEGYICTVEVYSEDDVYNLIVYKNNIVYSGNGYLFYRRDGAWVNYTSIEYFLCDDQ